MQKLVLIDDEIFFRKAMKIYLEEWKDEYALIGEANNGKDGLELIRKYRPDIVLMDINMQIMSGLEVMQHLWEEKINSKIILLSGFSEFEYAHKAIKYGASDYLLKPIDKEALRKCLQSVSEKIWSDKQYKNLTIKYYSASIKVKEHFVDKIFSAQNVNDYLEINNMASELMEDITCRSYGTILINFCTEDQSKEYTKKLSEKFFCVANVLTELFEQKGILCFTSSNNKDLRVVTSSMSSPEVLVHDIQIIISQSMDYLNKLIDEKFQISIGSAQCHLQDISKSVSEAERVQSFLRLYHKSGVFTIHQLSGISANNKYSLGGLYSKFILYVQLNDMEATRDCIDRIFKEIREKEIDPEIVILFVKHMILSIEQEYAARFGKKISPESQASLSGFEEDTIDLIQKRMSAYIENIMHLIEQNPNSESMLLSKNVMNYIDNNYAQYNLSLAKLSSEFGMSKTILCKQFKEAHGKTIGEYLLQVRMTHAMEMLDRGYQNVAYIADKCGYEDAGYFSKCFKKYFGISPTDYSETHTQ